MDRARPCSSSCLAASLLVLPTFLDDPTRTRQWAEYLCYAMLAVGLDIAWGYGGMLALGQGVFFGLGAYAMGMYLSLEQVARAQLPSSCRCTATRPSCRCSGSRSSTSGSRRAGAAGPDAGGRRCSAGWSSRGGSAGPYFALLTQATALVFSLLLVGQLKLTAGTNGLTDFTTVFGRNKYDPDTNTFLYYIAAGAARRRGPRRPPLVRSRYGRLLVAVRDSEDRVRFLGYDPAVVKTVAFVVAGRHGRRWPGRWPRRSSASSPPTSSRCCRRS